MTVALEEEQTEKRIPRSRLQKMLAVALVCIVLTSIAVLPFFVIGEDQKIGCCGGAMPVTHDAWMHYNQMNSFWQSLAAGIIYPRWDETTHGYGAPTTSFYPPGVYYLTSAVYFVARDWRLSWMGFYWLTMLASAVAIYWYARQWLSRRASLMAMAAYIFAPYHLINQYQRGAMSEFTSFIWIPLCLLFAERLIAGKVTHREDVEIAESTRREKISWINFAGLAASFGAFLWTHPPTAYQFLLVFGACVFVPAVRAGKWRRLGVILLSLLFGSMLAAAYFFPAIVEQRLVNYDDVTRVWPYHASYVFDFSQTVYDHVGNPFFVRIDCIWAFSLVAIQIAALSLWRSAGAAERNIVPWKQWSAAGLLACLLMTKYSAPLGRLIPKIEIGVFSWRMLALASFALAMLAGAMADWRIGTASDSQRGFPKDLVAALRSLPLAVLILLGALAMSGWYVVWPMWRGQAFEPNPAHYNYATLPRGASRDNPPMPPVRLASGNGAITVERWTPEFRQLQVRLAQADQLQFRTRNFAGWTATIDGQTAFIKEDSGSAVKNIVVDLPPGNTRVTLEFRSTPIRRASNWITVVSFAALLSIVIIGSVRNREP